MAGPVLDHLAWVDSAPYALALLSPGVASDVQSQLPGATAAQRVKLADVEGRNLWRRWRTPYISQIEQVRKDAVLLVSPIGHYSSEFRECISAAATLCYVYWSVDLDTVFSLHRGGRLVREFSPLSWGAEPQAEPGPRLSAEDSFFTGPPETALRRSVALFERLADLTLSSDFLYERARQTIGHIAA